MGLRDRLKARAQEATGATRIIALCMFAILTAAVALLAAVTHGR